MGADEARLESEPLGRTQEVVRAGNVGCQAEIVPDGIGVSRSPQEVTESNETQNTAVGRFRRRIDRTQRVPPLERRPRRDIPEPAEPTAPQCGQQSDA